MAGEQQRSSKKKNHKKENKPIQAKDLNKKKEELTEEIEDLIDEIDDILEKNAEQFVKQYVQRGGE